MRAIGLVCNLAAVVLLTTIPGPGVAQGARHAQDSAAAIAGSIRSQRDGPLEGVVVIAQQAGSGVLTAVSTDAAGRFRFPRDHLRVGGYSISIRATGYEWPESAGPHRINVTGNSTAELDVTLTPITDLSTLASQLTSLEWLNSFPGTTDQKDAITHNVVNCGFCHSLERIARSRHTAGEFRSVIQRMSTYEPDHSSAERVQIASILPSIEDLHWWGRDVKAMSEYLAVVNLSGGRQSWSYPLKVMPRPRGKATRAIITVFPIPRPQSVVHDLDVDADGRVWYGNTALPAGSRSGDRPHPGRPGHSSRSRRSRASPRRPMASVMKPRCGSISSAARWERQSNSTTAGRPPTIPDMRIRFTTAT